MMLADPPEPALERPVPFLRRVAVRDYKSIDHASVELGSLTILVGRNGSGKSNFLDVLRFVADCLQISLDHAVKSRGGIHEIRRRAASETSSVTLSLDLPGQRSATYEFAISGHGNSFAVAFERLAVHAEAGAAVGHYEVNNGKVIKASFENPPPAQADRLYLVTASGFSEFRPVYDALASMGFYDFDPKLMRSLQAPDSGELLRRDGSNIASVLGRLAADQPQILERITQYLSAIVSGLVSVERATLGPVETLRFKQLTEEPASLREFFAWSMSDGTLRALGALVAACQFVGRQAPGVLVAIEEPETSLHPAATAALMDALSEASSLTQILITSHSPDLLDHVELETESLLAVAFVDGVTRVAPIDQASLKVIQKQLFTPGELLKMDQLEPDRDDLLRQERESLPMTAGQERV